MGEEVVISASHHVQDSRCCQILSFVVDLDIFTNPVLRVVLLSIQRAWESILWIASVVSRQHQQDLIVTDASFLQVLVEDQSIQTMSIVKVELASTKDDIEVVLITLSVLLRLDDCKGPS